MTNEFSKWQKLVNISKTFNPIEDILLAQEKILNNNMNPSTLIINPSDLNELINEVEVPQIVTSNGTIGKILGMNVVVSDKVNGFIVK